MEKENVAKSRASVSREIWGMHILKQLQKDDTILIVWQKRAQMSRPGMRRTPCPLANVKLIKDAGFLEKVGPSSDGKGVIYRLKDGVVIELEKPKSRSRKRPKAKVTKSEDDLDKSVAVNGHDEEDQDDIIDDLDEVEEDLTPEEEDA